MPVQIQLGEIENGERVSRISANGRKKVEAVTRDILDQFVIIWDYTSGYLVLGKKGDWLPLLQWRDESMTKIFYYGIRNKFQQTPEESTMINYGYYTRTTPRHTYYRTSDEKTGHWLIECKSQVFRFVQVWRLSHKN